MLPSRQEDSDQDLIAAVNRGDAAAFDRLYLRYRDRIHALAWRFTRDEHLAAEVMQETFLYLLRKFPGFALRCELFTLLYPVVRHTAIAAVQRQRRPAPDAAESLTDPPTAAPDLVDLDAALAALPEGQAEVVRLRFAHDLSLAGIAQALGVPLGTVKSRLHLALAALQRDPRLRRFFEP